MISCYYLRKIFLSIAVIVFFQHTAYSSESVNIDEPDIQTFLTEYYSIYGGDTKPYCKLLFAVEKGYTNVAIKLLENGENPNYLPKDQNIYTPFLLAVYKENEELVSKMINKGADVNLVSYMDWRLRSPLEVAVENNKSEKITQMLCNAGVKVDGSLWIWGLNPLAITIQKVDVPKFFLIADMMSDSDIRRIDVSGTSFLTIPMGIPTSNKYKEDTIKIAEYLSRRGVPMETNTGSALTAAILVGNQNLFEFLLNVGSNVNYIPKENGYRHMYPRNPLFSAILYYENRLNKSDFYEVYDEFISEKIDFLNILIDFGAELNFSIDNYIDSKNPQLSHDGFSPLSYAISHNLNEVAVFLINSGADVNMIDKSNKTPLYHAVEVNNLDGVNLLLSSGADPIKVSKSGKTPINIAYLKGYSEILKVLVEAESKVIEKNKMKL